MVCAGDLEGREDYQEDRHILFRDGRDRGASQMIYRALSFGKSLFLRYSPEQLRSVMFDLSWPRWP